MSPASSIAAPKYLNIQPDNGLYRLGVLCVCCYTFMVFSRIIEFLTMKIGTGLYIMPAVMFVSLAAAALTGELLQMARDRAVRLFVIFSLWFVFVSFPFSIWKGGSLPAVTYQLKMALIFVAIIGVVRKTTDVRKVMFALALTMFFTLFVGFTTSLTGDEERFSFEAGSFANANELANHLLIGLPFCLVLLIRRSTLSPVRWLCGGVLLGTVALLVKTGSRGAFIDIVILMLIVFLSANLKNKLKIILGGAVVVLIGIGTMSQVTLDRYKTIFSSSGRVEAEESKASRMELLRWSLIITAHHPLTGVGPANFMAELNHNLADEGLGKHWEVTHDAFTQISSEIGLPALFCYVGIFFFTMYELSRIRKDTRNIPDLAHISTMCSALLLSMTSYLISGVFTSNAHQFYFPLLTGLGVVLTRAAHNDLRVYRMQKAEESAQAEMFGASGLEPAFAAPGFTSRLPRKAATLAAPGYKGPIAR